MNNKDFINELSKKVSLSGKETEDMVNGLLATITERLQNDDTINISGFGAFEVKKKMERLSVNPKTGKRMLVPPKLTVVYKPSATLKDKYK